MFQPAVNEFQLRIASATNAAVGTSFTPGNNTYGTYVQLLAGAAVTEDAFGIAINVNTLFVTTQGRDALVKIGIDPSGGSSPIDVIPDLLVSAAANFVGGVRGINYYFPIFIKAGSSVWISGSVNNATVGTGNAIATLFCRPSRPELVRAGSFVRAFGINRATSSGTAITPVNGSKSAYVQLGSALAEPLWWWCGGIGVNSNNMNNNAFQFDWALGSSTTTNRAIIVDQWCGANLNELLSWDSWGVPALGAVGDLVFSRAACGGTVFAGFSVGAYGVGG